jgi:hypothetical protein
MTDTFRALCEELIGTWAVKSELGFSDFWDKIADIDGRARAALAQPEPPSVKEQALKQLTQLVVDLDRAGMRQQASTLEGPIRQALEAL